MNIEKDYEELLPLLKKHKVKSTNRLQDKADLKMLLVIKK